MIIFLNGWNEHTNRAPRSDHSNPELEASTHGQLQLLVATRTTERLYEEITPKQKEYLTTLAQSSSGWAERYGISRPELLQMPRSLQDHQCAQVLLFSDTGKYLFVDYFQHQSPLLIRIDFEFFVWPIRGVLDKFPGLEARTSCLQRMIYQFDRDSPSK